MAMSKSKEKSRKNVRYTHSKQLFSLSVAVFCLLSLCFCKPTPDTPVVEDPELKAACNYIAGAGSTATGGMGGSTYLVSMLEDSIDPSTNKPVMGTLRYAVEAGEARVVMFRVSGIIHLRKPLEITKGNITIAGQTAPGDGICLADYPLIIKGCNNVIVRFIRVRMGEKGSLKNDKEYDAVSPVKLQDVYGVLYPDTDETTYHGWGRRSSGVRIDFVWTSPGLEPVSSRVIKDKAHGLFLSDHYPVEAVVRLH